MSENEVENKLKKQAKKIKMQSFSKRYKAIEDELFDSQSQDVVINGNLKAKSREKLTIIIGFAIIAVLIISTIIIFSFNKSETPLYYSMSQIIIKHTNSAEEFYSFMEEAAIYPQVDLSSYSVYSYGIYYFDSEETENIQGGCFSALDEDESGDVHLMADIKFYTNKVVLNEIDYNLSTDIDDITINFKISETDDWQWQAQFITAELVYRIDFVNIDGEEQSFMEFLNNIL